MREGILELLWWEGGRFSRFKGQVTHGRSFVSRRRASHSAASPLAMPAMHRLLVEGVLGGIVSVRWGFCRVTIVSSVGGVTYRSRAADCTPRVWAVPLRGRLGGFTVVLSGVYQTVRHSRLRGFLLGGYRGVGCVWDSSRPAPATYEPLPLVWGGGASSCML